MVVLLWVLFAVWALWLWLSGHWFGRAVAFLVFGVVFGVGLAAAMSNPAPAIFGIVAAWFVAAIPIELQHRKKIERAQQDQHEQNAPLAANAGTLRQQEDFIARCNEVYDAGIRDIPGFKNALENFRTIGGLSVALIEAALETDAPGNVLHYLGNHIEEAEALQGLSPARLGVAVAKLASRIRLLAVLGG